MCQSCQGTKVFAASVVVVFFIFGGGGDLLSLTL
jgi:hypothetical protein